MAIDTIVSQLAALEVFRGLEPEWIERIARSADRIIHRGGQTIVEAGSTGDASVLIVAGRARALARPDMAFPGSEVGAGTLIGELAMLTEHQFALTVVAVDEVRAIRIAREAVHRLLKDDPALAEHFQARLTSRLLRAALDLRLIDERLAEASARASAA
jgi:NTE family protein